MTLPDFGDLTTQDAACTALTYDRDRLLDAAARAQLEPGSVAIHHNPLTGGTPMTVIDLVQHVAMWDEIVLLVLAESRRGRAHWYVDPRWAPVEIGRALNRGGVEAGRLLPPALVISRFHGTRDALIQAIAEVPAAEWDSELPFRHAGSEPQTISGLSFFVNTPEADPKRQRIYQHACVHLGLGGGD